MLKADYYVAPTDLDLLVFEKLIPADHYLRRLKAAINFEPVRALVADCYVEGLGAPAADPVRLLKLSLLQFQYDLSDSHVLRQESINRSGEGKTPELEKPQDNGCQIAAISAAPPGC